MRNTRWIVLVAIAVLALGAVGASGYRALARSAAGPASQSQDCANQDDDAGKIESEDADRVELQCGDQNDAGGEEDANTPDTDGLQEGDQNAPDTESEGGEATEHAPTGTPAITAQAAQDTAEAYLNAGTATQVELDDEDGALIYSVEIGGSDVKVDAMTGVVLSVESGQD
jgi:uncharacterized membrane protein YkoI